MCRLHFNLCLIAVALLMSHLVCAQDAGKTSLSGDEEILPPEQTIDAQDDSMVEKKASAAQSAARESFKSDFNSNMETNTGFPLSHGAMQDAQESSASNKVVLVLNNDKSKFGDFVKPAEESLRRLSRNPDAIDDIIGQFQQLGGDMTQQFMQQVSQTAPDMSKSFGQALNEVLTQTSLLVSPVNLNMQNLTESSALDLGQLGQNFLVGATQNLFNANKDQAETEPSAPVMPGIPGATAPNTKTDIFSDQNAANSRTTKNPFENLVGQSLLPQFPQLSQFGQLNPFGMFAQFSALAPPLMPAGSEISEVRVLPAQYSPYKLTLKQVEPQTMAEMKLKAVLKDSLTKKTIPILWFHMPTNHKLPKNSEDMLMETKLQMFEHQVISDLKQLQEIAKMANEVKRAQLESGVQPTESLTKKLNLSEIPVYDITLGDIERTLDDEHVIMLMQTLVQQTQNKEFQRHQQATTKYLTDLTGAPNKRQVKTPEDTLNSMEKDDMMKMMAYAYRMASLHGHEMPWIKKNDMTMSNEKEAAKSTSPSGKEEKLPPADTQVNTETKWLEDKQKQLATEEAKQRRMFDERQGMPVQSPIHHWADPAMLQQQQQQQQIAMQRQMNPQMPQMMTPQMQHPMPQPLPMPMHNQMINLDAMLPPDLQGQIMPQYMMSHFNLQQQIPMVQQQEPAMMQMFWPEPRTAQQIQTQSVGTNVAEIMSGPKQNPELPQQIPNVVIPQPMMSNGNMQEQMPVQREQQMPMMMPQMWSSMQHNPDFQSNFGIPQPMMANAYMQEQRPMMTSDMRSSTGRKPEQTLSREQINNFRMPQPMVTRNDGKSQMEMQTQQQQFRMPPAATSEQRTDIKLPQPVVTNVDVKKQMEMQTQQQQIQRPTAGIPEQKPEQQMPVPRTDFRMPQAGMTHFGIQQQMAVQRLYQQPLMMPEMRSSSEQRPEQAQGLGTEKTQLTDSKTAVEKTNQTTEQIQKTDMNTETPASAANTNTMPTNSNPVENEVKPEIPENEEKARIRGHHHHHGWHAVHNHNYNAGKGHYKPPHGPSSIIPHNKCGHGHVYGPDCAHYSIPARPIYIPAPSCYGGGAHGSKAYGSPYGAYRAAVGDEEIAIMLQQQQQQEHMPVTFFRK